jgi:hypothetical protein
VLSAYQDRQFDILNMSTGLQGMVRRNDKYVSQATVQIVLSTDAGEKNAQFPSN